MRIKRALVTGGEGGSSFVGLDEREDVLTLTGVGVGVDVTLPRRRRTPFILEGMRDDVYVLAELIAGHGGCVRVMARCAVGKEARKISKSEGKGKLGMVWLRVYSNELLFAQSRRATEGVEGRPKRMMYNAFFG